jgi:hypothetical protein
VEERPLFVGGRVTIAGAARPLHVAVEDSYIRMNCDPISGISFNATGETIRGDSQLLAE